MRWGKIGKWGGENIVKFWKMKYKLISSDHFVRIVMLWKKYQLCLIIFGNLPHHHMILNVFLCISFSIFSIFQNTLFSMWISIYISTTSQLDLIEIDIIVIIIDTCISIEIQSDLCWDLNWMSAEKIKFIHSF